MSVTVAERARRSDAGKVRLTPRDVQALTWLEDMRAISEPDLAVLLTRLSGRDADLAGLISPAAVQAVVKRWARAKVARRSKLLVAWPAYIWLTAGGARMAAGARHWAEPDWSVMQHTGSIARARLWLEAHPNPALHAEPGTWRSERSFRREHNFGTNAKVLTPDGQFVNSHGVRVAVEVELTAKSDPEKVAKKVRRMATAWDAVLYLVPEGSPAGRSIRTAIVTASKTTGDDIYRRVLVEDLPERLEL